jgi:hypothetical protein
MSRCGARLALAVTEDSDSSDATSLLSNRKRAPSRCSGTGSKPILFPEALGYLFASGATAGEEVEDL